MWWIHHLVGEMEEFKRRIRHIVVESVSKDIWKHTERHHAQEGLPTTRSGWNQILKGLCLCIGKSDRISDKKRLVGADSGVLDLGGG